MSIFFRSQQPQAGHTRGNDIPSRVSLSAGSFMVDVTPSTSEQVIAFDACVSLQSNVISSLPLGVFTGRGAAQRPASVPAWLEDPGGAGYGLEDWLKQWLHSACYTGNVIATVEARDGNGLPAVLAVRDLGSVTHSARKGWLIAGERYRSSDVVHYRRWPRPGSRWGSSAIERHATTLGLALSAERFGRQWFQDGAHPQSTLESPDWIDEDEIERLRARLIDPARGSREPVILGGGLQLKAWQVAPNESQFLETQGYTSAQVCRIFGPGLAEILGYPTGDSNTYKNREQTALDLLAYTLDPWLTDLEKLLSRLMGPTQAVFDGRYVAFDRNALLRTDLLTRYQAYRIGLGPSEPFITANEARLNEAGLPPVAWGSEKPTIQGADTPAPPAGGAA